MTLSFKSNKIIISVDEINDSQIFTAKKHTSQIGFQHSVSSKAYECHDWQLIMLSLATQASSKKHSTSISDAEELHKDTKEMAEKNEHFCATKIKLVG